MNKITPDDLSQIRERLMTQGSHVRQFGKTIYACYNILGYLQVLNNEDIVVLIQHHNSLPNYFNMLDNIFRENNLEPIYNISMRRIAFKNNTNRIKFVTIQSIQKNNPMDFSNSYDVNIITDLEEMDNTFYWENFTIGENHKLNQWLQAREVMLKKKNDWPLANENAWPTPSKETRLMF